MNKPVNLNRTRKDRERAMDKARADENSRRFGRTKAERLLDATRTEKAARMLDQNRLQDEE